jgi:hypothetical protein
MTRADIKATLEKVFQTNDRDLKSQLYVFLACIGISLFFWLLIKLSKEYSTTIEYPVSFYGFPSDYYLTKAPEPYLSLEVNSTGSDLISLKYFSGKKDIDINLNSASSFIYGKHMIIKVPTANYVKKAALSTAYYDKLNRISPDTLYFHLEKIESKTVPVRANVDIQLEKQYYYYDSIHLIPDSITLSGIGSELDLIDHVNTERFEDEDIDDELNEELELVRNEKCQSIRYSVAEVQLKADVQEFTEDLKLLDIDVFGVPEGYEVKLYPERAKLKYMVALKDYKNIDASSFTVAVELDNIEADKEMKKLPLKVVRKPKFVRILHLEPAEVEFILFKKYD